MKRIGWTESQTQDLKVTTKEARLYERVANKLRCGLCPRRCLVGEGERGHCKVRVNNGGKLYTLLYGNITNIESRPIEIKPFFHFFPGSTALTFSSWSCNLDCPWCQNWHLSKSEPDLSSKCILPGDMVREALTRGDQGLSVSFNEPTLLFEYCLDVFPLAREEGLYSTFVSNGYLTWEALSMLCDAGLDAIKIDVKGDDEVYKKYCYGEADRIWETAHFAKTSGLHVEMVNLVITGVNDREKDIKVLIRRHLQEVGEDVPLHFTRYHPAYRFKNPPTDIEILKKAYQWAREEGVLYPYLGNMPGHPEENTYCPKCEGLLIRRLGCSLVEYNLSEDNLCPDCGFRIAIITK